ncbi:hypothetical protein AAG570_009391 [Ranatra chinensis]|uniref:Uncharacterized protein n=1 Tax=Ranatra chinensis TaxID=642074 RepID=A0ABD0YP72_9HEMI
MAPAFIALVISLFLSTVAGVEEPSRGDPSLKLLSKLLDDCSSTDFTTCLQAKAVAFFDRAARSQNIPLWESVNLVKTSEEDESSRSSRAITEQEITEAKSQGKLADLLWDGVARFMNTHTLKIDLPKVTSEELSKSAEEGRGKMKKMMSMMMMAGFMKMATIVPTLLGFLFLLAGKAFIISKLALVLTLIIMVKKMLSAGGAASVGHYGLGHYGAAGAGWDRRSVESQRLAYRGQKH